MGPSPIKATTTIERFVGSLIVYVIVCSIITSFFFFWLFTRDFDGIICCVQLDFVLAKFQGFLGEDDICLLYRPCQQAVFLIMFPLPSYSFFFYIITFLWYGQTWCINHQRYWFLVIIIIYNWWFNSNHSSSNMGKVYFLNNPQIFR